MAARHELLGGKVQIFMRANSPYWQCSASVGGRQFRASTKTDSLAQAKDFANDWFLTLNGKHRFGGGIEPKRTGKTFREAGEKFVLEYETLMEGERNPKYVQGHSDRLRVHLYPYFGDRLLSEITPGLIQEYRAHRMTSRLDPKTGLPKKPARTTLHHEMVTLRQTLKVAHRHGWLPVLPDLSTPYKSSGKIVHRAWFSPAEYKQLYEATRARAAAPHHPRWKTETEDFHDYILFMVNTGLRPDEAGRLEYRDVEIVRDADSDQTILEIEVRGKRGVGYCKSMPGAVQPLAVPRVNSSTRFSTNSD
jgi:hypothetical protein